ncbi:MAG: ribonuclease H-like domain-containing protein, partial [Candidatus Thorarchaeota archaeon]
VYFIGEHIERQLNRKGIRSLYDLKINLRYKDSASEILQLINSKQYEVLCKNRYIYDLDVIFCFNQEQLLFIDIETLGLYDNPIIILGLGYYKNKKFEVHALFARNLEEEIAICEHFKSVILPQFKCFITYNGKSFDIPYIANRLLYFFDENPMISEEEIPYKKSNSLFHHIDLYHNCRRKFRGCYNRYTLTDMEDQLLNLKRENDLPSNLVGFCYERYLEKPKRYIGLIKEIIDHNYWDVYSMPLLLQKLLKT